MINPVISAADLAGHPDRPSLRIIDATWNIDGSDALGPFQAGHIPGAVFFDIDAVSDPDTGLPHMLPTPEAFAQAVSALGIGTYDTVVIYDQIGIRSAPRLWWTFRVFGHDRVQVLDGGLPAWLAEGRPVERGPASPRPPADFKAIYRPALVRAADQILADIEAGRQLLDARPSGRFRGEASEPRPGLRSGHIPGSRNLPFPDVLSPDGFLLAPDQLRDRFADAGIDLAGDLTTTCGSGMTAAILALAAARAGNWHTAVYDGSWAEWGTLLHAPVLTGPA